MSAPESDLCSRIMGYLPISLVFIMVCYRTGPDAILLYYYMQSILIGRAKRTPHWGVQSRFRVIYMSVCLSYVKLTA